YEFVDLFFGDDEWRQHSKHSLMRAIQNKSALQHLLYDVFSRNLQLDRKHQSLAAHFLHDRQILQFFKSLLEVAAYFTYMFQEIFLFEDLEIFQAGPACQRASPECRAVLARFDSA